MMEFKAESAALSLCENGTIAAECTVDADCLLLDYCPDIAAVLKCTMTPAVLARRWSGDKLLVEGQAAVRVLYLDEGRKCVRTFECVQPFSCTLQGDEGSNTLPYVTVKVNYLNCRAVSPRRMDVHGTLTASCKNDKKRTVELLSAIEGDAVYSKKDAVSYSVTVGSAEKNFSVSEMADLGVSKPPAECIIKTTCTPVVDSVKLMTDKAIVKGKVVLDTLYTASVSEGTTACATHEFPFGQILDMEGVTETNNGVAHIDVLTCEVQIVPDQNGNATLLAVNIKLCLRLDATCEQEVAFVADAYAGNYPCHTEVTQFSAEKLLFSRQDSTSLKEVLDLPSDTVAEIVDLWCEVVSLATRTEQQHAYVDGRLQISMLAKDREGCISYYEHMGDFVLQFADVCDRLTAEVCITDTEFAVVGGKIEIRLELCSVRCGYAGKQCKALCGFEPAAEPYEDEKAALRICRAKRGDSVWEIAKTYHTAVDAVLEENAITGDCLSEDMLLLIPLC